MKRHALKTLPEYFEELATGRKTFELRLDDRGFAVGDVLDLCEWTEARGYTGRAVSAVVGYILRRHAGLRPGYVVMSLRDVRIVRRGG